MAYSLRLRQHKRDGHINCHSKGYWVALFLKYGCQADRTASRRYGDHFNGHLNLAKIKGGLKAAIINQQCRSRGRDCEFIARPDTNCSAARPIVPRFRAMEGRFNVEDELDPARAGHGRIPERKRYG
jgi:hypothetical protein